MSWIGHVLKSGLVTTDSHASCIFFLICTLMVSQVQLQLSQIVFRKMLAAARRSFVAPLGLTAFTGSDESPTVLCSINLDHSVRKLEESYTVNLGATDFAEYIGEGTGSKEQLQEDIMNTQNWHHDQTRRLGGFTIASNVTVTETTTMVVNTTTASMTMTTTMTTTLTVIEGIETKATR